MANFQSLEFALRAFLTKYSPPPFVPYAASSDVFSFPVGSVLPENPLTNYDSLGMLIEKANKLLRQQHAPQLDKSLVDIRDALAHGRISSLQEEEQLRLIKYSKPDNGQVEVKYNEVLDEQWFTLHKRRVRDAISILLPFVQS